jgi:hypothetical protein
MNCVAARIDAGVAVQAAQVFGRVPVKASTRTEKPQGKQTGFSLFIRRLVIREHADFMAGFTMGG